MKKIKLTQGKFALVDDNDFKWLNQWKWCYQNGYVVNVKYLGRVNGRTINKTTSMHRLIMGEPDALVDHKDCLGTNNQRANLRVSNRSTNAMNRGKTKANTSGYKGVFLHGANLKKPWRARIKSNHMNHHLGFFKTAQEAAIAYNEAAPRYHKNFAKLNEL